MTVPIGTVAEMLDWVGDDPDRADLALQAEYTGQQRSTLIAQLEAIATKEATTMTDSTTEEVELAPGPEPPDVFVDPEDTSTTVLNTVTAHSEVEVEDVPSDGAIVESIGGAVAPHGFVLVLNGEAFVFSPQLTASLQMTVNSAIAGVAL
jgi:hypothetical protein